MRCGAEESERVLRSPSSPFPSPPAFSSRSLTRTVWSRSPCAIACGINSNAIGCSSRNNRQTITSRSGRRCSGRGLLRPYPTVTSSTLGQGAQQQGSTGLNRSTAGMGFVRKEITVATRMTPLTVIWCSVQVFSVRLLCLWRLLQIWT